MIKITASLKRAIGENNKIVAKTGKEKRYKIAFLDPNMKKRF